MKKMKYIIAFAIITSILLINICYGKEVVINAGEFDSKLTSAIVKSLQNNTFLVEDETNSSVKIKANDKSFWIQKKYVTEVNSNSNAVQVNNEEMAKQNKNAATTNETILKIVNTDVLNIREANSVDSAKISTINRNEKVEVLRSVYGWDYIRFNEVEGWASSEYLILPDSLVNITNNSVATTEVSYNNDRGINKEVYVTASLLNVRDGASTSANKIGSVTYYNSVTVVGIENGWYKIKFNNGYGYISADYTMDKSEIASRGNYDRDSSSTSLASNLADKALTYVGHRYVYGGASPSGFDCSGLVYYVYKPYVTNLPRNASKQAKIGTFVDKSNLQRGDLVFFGNYGRGVIEHVGIYIGNGNFVHAATSKRGVVVDTLLSGYHCTNYITARRVI